ncbi:hypothetical protein IPM65_07020 [Candidatus Roizmanbacteria bacterium]|nr:MAG: hypothetical protein IPM65_07020 [Candidatus Roizmanbacteria bacterium]
MKDIQLNPLNSNQRRLLQFGVVIALGIFLAGWYYFMKQPSLETEIQNNSIYIQNSTLYAFDDTYNIAQYPNRVSVHYPYLFVIKPTEQITHVYNLTDKTKEDIQEVLLDYADGFKLRNDGKSTFLNDKDLGVLCEKGFIKNELEVLCLTKVNPNTVENKLVSIDTATNKQTEIYVSQNLVTDFSVIKDRVYMGEIDLYNKKNYLIIGEEKMEVPSVVSLIYEMKGNPYFATFKGELSEEAVYYEIMGDKIKQVEKKKIYLYIVQ